MAAEKESAAGMPQLDFSTFGNQIFWLVIALIAFYLVISRLALPRIGAIIDERRDVVTNDLARANDLKQQAEESQASYEASLAEARAQAARILAEAKSTMQADMAEANAEAEAEIAARTAEAEAKISEIRANAATAIRTVATDVAAEIVNKLLPAAQDAEAVQAAVDAEVKG